MLKQVMVAGRSIEVPRLKFGQTLKLIAMIKNNVKALGLTAEDLKEKEFSSLTDILGILSDVLGKAFEDYDLEAGTPGPLMMDVMEILSELTQLSFEEINDAQFDELFDFISTIVEQEATSSVGKSLGGMIQPITSLLYEAIGMVRARMETTILLASAGGQSSGGETSSFTPSAESTESSPENLDSLISEKFSDSNEA